MHSAYLHLDQDSEQDALVRAQSAAGRNAMLRESPLHSSWFRSAFEGGASYLLCLGAGVFGGLAIGLSAWMQGKVAAASSDSLAETGKGTANYFIVIGITETVALFTLVFCLLLLG